MAIAVDATSSKQAGNVSSSSLSHTCTGTNLVLVVGVQADSAADPTGITYNSVAMTKATSLLNGGIETSVWYLANPATGAHNITVTFAASHYFNFFGISLTGCATSSPLDGTQTGNGTTNDAKVSLSCTNSGAFRIASVFHNRNSSRTAIAGSTIQTDVYENTDNFHGLDITNSSGTTGAVDIGETMGTASDGWWISAMGVAPAVTTTAQGAFLLNMV